MKICKYNNERNGKGSVLLVDGQITNNGVKKQTLILTMNIHHENFHVHKALNFQSILTMIITQKPFST